MRDARLTECRNIVASDKRVVVLPEVFLTRQWRFVERLHQGILIPRIILFPSHWIFLQYCFASLHVATKQLVVNGAAGLTGIVTKVSLQMTRRNGKQVRRNESLQDEPAAQIDSSYPRFHCVQSTVVYGFVCTKESVASSRVWIPGFGNETFDSTTGSASSGD
jgi:hypothetical protein